MSNLYNKLVKVYEETTSADIAYAPGSLFGDHSPDVITPNFPGLTANWEDLKRARVRKRKMREAMENQVAEIQANIVQSLKNIAFSCKLTYNQYVRAFNYTKDLTPPSILIDLMKKEADVNLITSVLGNDLGELQLILASLEAQKPLTKFGEFQKYDYIAGCRLQSIPTKTVIFIYEGVLDQEYIERETIAISDPDIVKNLQERIKNKIITSGKWSRVFPIDTYFDTNFYNTLKEVVTSDFDGANGGEDDVESEEEIE